MSPEVTAEVPPVPTTAPSAAPAAASTAVSQPILPAVPGPGTSDLATAGPTTAAALALPAPAADGVLGGRERIDAVDAQIVELVQRRIEISRQIQAARLADGGRRVDLRRETEIIGRYTSGLGRPGTSIAMSLLELCRGRA
jgi:chorismate mutase